MEVLFLSSLAHEQSFGKILKYLLENDGDRLAYITERISHIASLGGHPQPPTAKRLKNIEDNELCEIRTKYSGGNLIRIYYFIHKEKRQLILLNAIIKPDGSKNAAKYSGKTGLKVRKEINTSIRLALQLKKEFLISQDQYELLTF